MKSLLLALAALALLAGSARAQTQIITTQPPLTGLATLSVLAASIPLSGATLAPNSPAFPTSSLPGRFIDIANAPASAGTLFVCLLGGTCTTANGWPIAVGTSKTWYIPSSASGQFVSPTVISATTATAVVAW